LFKQERETRALRHARAQAEAVESYRLNLIPAYRQAANLEMDRERIKHLVPLIFRGRPLDELLTQNPRSYPNLRDAV